MSVNLGTMCPNVQAVSDVVSLSHGEGGRLMRRMIRERIAAKFRSDSVQLDSDAANLGAIDGQVAVTTDSYVVSPLFFPGGDIGSLSVHGTVNDLAMAGAKPLFLTLSLILEEGLAMDTLDRVIQSVAEAAEACDVSIVTGDTKVVPKGAADGLFINTTGVGVFRWSNTLKAASIKPGDCLIVSGPIARHGLAVLAARESFGFSPPPTSDSAPLHGIAAQLIDSLGDDLRTMRDATRGGIAAVMHEWAEDTGLAMWIDESKVPLLPESKGICEILGLDPLFVANEGTFLAAVASSHADDALAILAQHPSCSKPVCIGHARIRDVSPVLVNRGFGADQPLDEPIAAMLPRIC